MPEVIQINLDHLKAQVLASLPHTADVERMVKGLGAAAMQRWKKAAQTELKSTAQDYIDALKLTQTRNRVTIELQPTVNGKPNPIPLMVEQGWDGGDMRQWLLKSPKAHQGAKGPYVNVPFRHGTPGTTERNVGRQMPKSIYQEAKQLQAQVGRPGPRITRQGGATVVHGHRLRPHAGMNEHARALLNKLEKPWHSTSIYMGMIRKEQVTSKKKDTSGYFTWRRISQFSRDPENHWIHPGIDARHLAEKVAKQLQGMIGQYVEAMLK